jgi:coenzyme F420-reducing hydrogenase gamma subunit
VGERGNPLWRWLRLRARRAFVVVGALPSEDAIAFVASLRNGDVLPIPVDAATPEDADVILVVGRISAKAAAPIASLRQRAPQAVIVTIDEPTHATYANAPPAAVLAADVVVRALPPSASAIDAVLDAILRDRRAEGV